MRRRSLTQDLAEAARNATGAELGAPPADRLATLEAEHGVVSERLNRLHESIELLEGLDNVKPDAALRLQSYRVTEENLSARRSYLHAEILRLRTAQLELEQRS